MSVCLCVGTLTAEPFGISAQYLVQGLALMICCMSSMVKVIGQRSRSPGQKNVISGSLIRVFGVQSQSLINKV